MEPIRDDKGIITQKNPIPKKEWGSFAVIYSKGVGIDLSLKTIVASTVFPVVKVIIIVKLIPSIVAIITFILISVVGKIR